VSASSSTEHTDVIIVGAGISGIGTAVRLRKECPGRKFTIVEGRHRVGGTWDLFRYPGVRSDSDMYTLGFGFKPWTRDKSLADGASIRDYLSETVDEYDLGSHIRFGHQVSAAEWSSETNRWTIQAAVEGEPVTLSCNVLFMCSGYYSYREGFTPEFAGRDQFRGTVVHPQHWPADLDYTGKRVVVIGSGATAVTLIPAIAKQATKVTMLQRSPTYIVSDAEVDTTAVRLRKVIGARAAYKIIRARNTTLQQKRYERARNEPEAFKAELLAGVRKALGQEYVDKHFTPTYKPWDQRLCLVPNGDLFSVISSGKADVVTDRIEAFDATGIILASGEHLEADIIVTATGLNLVTLGEMSFMVDGEPVDFSKSWTYKGVAYSDVPNLASIFGYINASWTLRSDLMAGYFCRLLNHMDKVGAKRFTPRLRASDADMSPHNWIGEFSSGYVERVAHLMPRQGDKQPWLNTQNHAANKQMLAKDPIDDGVLQFS
jgi:monooxygenase